MTYPANSGSFGATGSDLGTAGLSALPYSPPAAQNGAPAKLPLTEDYQEYVIVETGFTETHHFHAITSSTPFIKISFEVLSPTGSSLVPSLTTDRS